MTADTRERASVVYVDRALWQALAQATTTDSFCRAWLALQCSMLAEGAAGIEEAVVVFGEPDVGPFAPIAVWPEGTRPSKSLAMLAEDCLHSREPILREIVGAPTRIAYPLVVDGHAYGVVALCLRGASADARGVLRQLQWGSAWLDAHVRAREGRDDRSTNQRLMTALDLIATTLGAERFDDALRALATALATQLECDRASIGVRDGGHARVRAISHSSVSGGRMNLMRTIGAAMDEALDQQALIVHPEPEQARYAQVSLAHRELAETTHGNAAVTVPMFGPDGVFAAMTLERSDRPFDSDEIELCRSVAMAVGPLLAVRHERERSWLARQGSALRRVAASLFGPRHALRRLGLALLVIGVVIVAVTPGEYRVAAESTVEGSVRRVIAAPIDGYVVAAQARPGDTVAAGDVLSSFDDRDLRLERLQVAAEQAQLNARLQEATANRERADAGVIRAQIEQTAARLALLDEQLARVQVRAPFDAVIVAGDLSQSLGAPVKRGDTLYELAPLDAYRVVLRLDEHDIADIEAGQTGTLVLAALPDDPLPIVVRRITPVATADEGINYFRVEADLEGAGPRIRPGMEGVAKVSVRRERLAWIWTHKLVRWIRLRTWAWMP